MFIPSRIIPAAIWCIIIVGHTIFALNTFSSESLSKTLVVLSFMTNLITFSGMILLLTKKRTVSQNIYTAILTFFALSGFCRIISFIFGIEIGIETLKSNSFQVFTGMLVSLMFVLYPIELIRPRFATKARNLIVFLAPILLIIVAGGVIHLLTNDSSQFYIYAFTATAVIYPIVVLIYLLRMNNTYTQKFHENYSNPSAYDVNFIINYTIGYLGLKTSYIVISILPSQENLLLQYMLILTFILTTFRFVLKQKELIEMSLDIDTHANKEKDKLKSKENTLIHSFPEYKEQLDRWMQNEKPYLDPNFQLIDLTKILPLNRTYISRLLNQGYKENFSSFVTRHRIEYSIILMQSNPKMPIHEIAESSGFTSSSVYSRTFKAVHGTTPALFREKQTTN
jgi:AraC-like DNA-binding protein